MRSTHRTGWSTFATESAEAKTAASDRRSELQHENCGVLCTSRTDGDGRRLQQKVQSRRLRRAIVIRSCRYKNCGVLCTSRTGGDGRPEGCGKRPPFRVAGIKTVEYCLHQAREGMIDVCSRKCRTEGCDKRPSFGVAGTKTAEYCAQHAPDGIVDVCSRKCRTEGCGKQ